MKYIAAMGALLLCLSSDPVAMLQAPFNLLQSSNQPVEAERLTGDFKAP